MSGTGAIDGDVTRDEPRPAALSRRGLIGLAVWLGLCLAVWAIGGALTRSSISVWYVDLVKPPLTPPNWVFPVVWTSLFVLMGVSVWLVWLRRSIAQAPLSYVLFVGQLAFNLGWSVLFFGLREPVYALAEVPILWLLVVATLIAFLRHHRPAGLLLVPYALWVSFAVYLNAGIVHLN